MPKPLLLSEAKRSNFHRLMECTEDNDVSSWIININRKELCEFMYFFFRTYCAVLHHLNVAEVVRFFLFSIIHFWQL